MENSLVTALAITVIGMTLLFLSLLLFYGLLTLLTATVKDRPLPTAELAEASAQETRGEEREVTVLRAAAISIALARAAAEQNATPAAAPTLDATDAERYTSPWWALHHQRQLTVRGKVRRDR